MLAAKQGSCTVVTRPGPLSWWSFEGLQAGALFQPHLCFERKKGRCPGRIWVVVRAWPGSSACLGWRQLYQQLLAVHTVVVVRGGGGSEAHFAQSAGSGPAPHTL